MLAEAGAHWSDTIIWAKDHFVLGRADYQRQYEPVWYGWPDGSQRHWAGGRDQGDVWPIPRPAVSPLHPTQKPLALVERAITNSSTLGDTVLDLCYQKMSSARMSRGETLVLVMQPAQDRSTHDLALAPGR